jgi:hypothetical protein
MPQENTNTVTVTQPPLTTDSALDTKPSWTITEFLLYKLDRNLCILGLVALGGWALWISSKESIPIATAAVGALSVYVGSRGGK